MTNKKLACLLVVIAGIFAMCLMTIDNQLNNRSKERILIACIQSDNCSNKFENALKE